MAKPLPEPVSPSPASTLQVRAAEICPERMSLQNVVGNVGEVSSPLSSQEREPSGPRINRSAEQLERSWEDMTGVSLSLVHGVRTARAEGWLEPPERPGTSEAWAGMPALSAVKSPGFPGGRGYNCAAGSADGESSSLCVREAGWWQGSVRGPCAGESDQGSPSAIPGKAPGP